MIADDDDAIRALLTELLQDAGYRVRRDEALAQRHAERADLLIADQQMPRLIGQQVIARLPMRLGRKPPLILMRAMACPPPPVVFLAKPFDPGRVMPLVRALLSTPAHA